MGDQINLDERFPEMKPISGSPPMFTLNGCGLSVYGDRDADSDTGTFVKTLCLCLVFVPVLAISSYRVANAENGGWYFLGKVPLSGFAKIWNRMLFTIAFAFACTAGWGIYTGSPSYKDAQVAAEAQELMDEGKLVRALTLYRRLHNSSPTQREAAKKAMISIYETAQKSGAGEQSYQILNALESIDRRTHGKLLPNMDKLVLEHTQSCLSDTPKLGLQYVALADKLRTPPEGLDQLRRQLLIRTVEKDPQDLTHVLQLCSIYEKERAFETCEKILLPVRDQLGSTEGARLLGTLMLNQEKYNEAYTLLHPYVTARMSALRKAEENYSTASERSSNLALRKLNSNPNSKAYKEIDAITDEDEQGRKVDEYLWKQMQQDPNLKRALEEYREAATFVPTAIDLGMLQLDRAQSAPDANARKEELEAAEQTFVAIGDVAGDSSDYQISLGEVYYWLGKEKEGDEQLENYLTSQKRAPQALIAVARILRRIGYETKTNELAQEAFDAAKDTDTKDAAVFLLSQTAGTQEEKVQWLEKGDKNNISMKIDLWTAQAELAREAGEDEKAAEYLHQAIAGYAQQPEDATILNNASLCYSSLYGITRNPEHFAQSASMIARAVELNPKGAILLQNAVDSLLKDTFVHVLNTKFDISTTQHGPGSSILPFLYQDAAGKNALLKEVCDHESFQKARTFNNRLYVLSSKNPRIYFTGMQIASLAEDPKELRAISKRLDEGAPDFSAYETSTKDSYNKVDNSEDLEAVERNLKKYMDILNTISQAQSPLSYAIVATTVVRLELSRDELAPQSDISSILELAQAAHKSAPCSATVELLQQVYAHQACRTLAQKHEDFKAFYDQGMKGLTAYRLLAYAAAISPELERLLGANPDIQQITQLVAAQNERFPNDMSVYDWAIVKHNNPALASTIKECVLRDEYMRESRSIASRYFDYAVGTRITDCMLAFMNDNASQAQKIAGDAIETGLPIPQMP